MIDSKMVTGLLS